jgi:hypothetical protein
MSEVRHPRLHAINERNRAIYFAERPQHKRQKTHRGDTGNKSEPKCQIIVAAGLEQGKRTFQLIPRRAILAGKAQVSTAPQRTATGAATFWASRVG